MIANTCMLFLTLTCKLASQKRWTFHRFGKDYSSAAAVMTVGDVATTAATSNIAPGSFWNHETMATLRLFGIVEKDTTGSTILSVAQNFSDTLEHYASTAARFSFRLVDDITSTATTSGGAGRTPFRRLIRSWSESRRGGVVSHVCKTIYHTPYIHCLERISPLLK